ncbi:MAG: adenylosuccinate lyase [Archaeoglobi archaeon]|nr:adenylosuccinate lyase [Candidatus Mnemosynella bozhongmuii]MDI3502465.1 adenylosuccinate lyase [Archaeoglobi archaeon]MDK2781785.1 adenylosuccinate lyase [Archaeoglobi archaeon]
MALHPVEYRYGTEEMKRIWSEENKLNLMVEVEIALARAEAELGLIPRWAAEEIEKCRGRVSVERVKEIEAEIHHDVMSVVRAMAELCGEAGEWIHFGATSNDILDTSLALQLRESFEIIERKLKNLRDIFVELAEKHKRTVCAGRTHGQIGIPTTLGHRFALWASELHRHLKRLREIRERALVGKIGGAVGTQASLGERGLEVQKRTMEILGLKPVDIANQVIQRDIHAEVIMLLANIATSLDKFCTTVRNLQRSEIREMEEGFGEKQVGSSTMPHKRNPIRCENICGLARIVRSMVDVALQNNVLWEERDLTNSSAERVMFVDAFVLLDHILTQAIRVFSGIRVYPENMRRNLELMKGVNMAEAIMIALAKKGVGRQRAHEILRRCSMKVYETGRHFKEILMEDEEVRRHLSEKEISELMNPENYLGTAVQQIEMVIEKIRREG